MSESGIPHDWIRKLGHLAAFERLLLAVLFAKYLSRHIDKFSLRNHRAGLQPFDHPWDS